MSGPIEPNGGTEGYATRRVHFSHPFTLGASPEIYSAGAYDVETMEHMVDVGGHVARIRVSTVLIIPTPSGTCSREVQGSELDHALSQDARRNGQSEPSENPDRGEADDRVYREPAR
jgi:hypothetical protein